MKISYLILAHTDPVHLGRLIAALDNRENSFFVHIDRKASIEEFSRNVPVAPRVTFLRNRQTISWGSFAIVTATIALIREALRQPTQADYYILLSGLDYPIKSGTAIAGFFSRVPGRQYIRYLRISDCPFLKKRISRYHFPDIHRRIAHTAEAILNRTLPERAFLPGITPYFGPQWWALTHECVSSTITYIDTHPRYAGFYRFTGIPDEMFFHTIILNSGFLDHTDTRVTLTEWDSLDSPVPEAGEHIKYIDWNISREQPAILDERDFEPLQRSPFLFARKFTTAKSSALVERINRELL